MRITTIRVSASVAALASAFVLVACGSSEVSGSLVAPTSPTAATPAPAPAPPPVGPSASATIAGMVLSNSGTASLARRASVVGMTVRVVGTSIVVTVDASGQFSLSGVPSGRVQLQFSASGVDARLDLDDVAEHEEIHITVRVNGSSAELEENARTKVDSKVELEGRVTLISGQTLRVADKDVLVPSGTPIRHGGTTVAFTDVHVGDRVHVRGMKTAAGVTAIEIEWQTGQPGSPGAPVPPPTSPTPPKDDDPKDDHPKDGQGVEVKGQVAGLSGSCSSLHFTVGTSRVVTSAKTEFRGTTCATLANGDQVQVKATKQSDGTLLAIGVQKEKKT